MTLSYLRIVVAAVVVTFSLGGQIAWGGAVCKTVNGLNWCYNPYQCGQACNDVCLAASSVPIADDAKWFAAQNTEEKCQAIATAFGLGTINFGGYTYACLEDFGNGSSPGGLTQPLFCSSYSGCPANHRTDMDELGIPCGPGGRRSICPCEVASPAPTLATTGLVVCAGVMLLYGVMKLSYRRV